jgi:uncharacterized integral membrane protein (TIGR00697 family)
MNKRYRLFLILAGFFITNTLVAEFIGIKIFSLEETLGFQPLNMKLFGIEGLGFNLTAGVMLWPVVFVMTDIINEYYGTKGVRFLSNMAVVLILYAFFMFYIGIKLVPNDWWQFQSGLHEDPAKNLEDMDLAFRRIFGQGLWIIIGSLVAFLVGQVVDVLVFHRIKKSTGESKIWLRATGSTVVSQFIDSYIVLIIAFYVGADWDIVMVLAIGTVNYLYKFSLAILLTPLIYLGHYLIDRYLGEKLATEMKLEAQGGTN